MSFVGAVYSAGKKEYYRLGREGDGHIPGIVDIKAEGIICLGVGCSHNVVIYEDGSAYCWGKNDCNQLGVNNGQENIIKKPQLFEIFKDKKLVWVHCGDKITVVLTDTGNVYVVGSAYISNQNEGPVCLQSKKPFIYCTCGVGNIYALDCNGDIFACTSSSGIGITYHLPEPICDIAAGSAFCIAVSVTGKAYAKGNEDACGCGKNPPSGMFESIKSLNGIPIARVFAYCHQAIAVARDGRVFVCGFITTINVRFGNVFTQLKELDGKKVCDGDCNDDYSCFVTENGEVYGCGASEDGRTFAGIAHRISTPTKCETIDGKVTFIRCGFNHSLALVNTRRPIHPGLRYFGLLVGKIRKPKIINFNNYELDIDIGSISSYGFLTEDIVETPSGESVVVGVDNDKVCVKNNNIYKFYKASQLKFLRRDSHQLKECKKVSGTMIVDIDPEYCAVFGFFVNEKIIINVTSKEGVIAGVGNGSIWFYVDNGLVKRVRDSTIEGIYKAISLSIRTDNVETAEYKRKLCLPDGFTGVVGYSSINRKVVKIECTNKVTYTATPAETVDNVKYKEAYCKILATINMFYIVYDYLTKVISIVEKGECSKIIQNSSFTQFDLVQLADGDYGTIKDVFPNHVLVCTHSGIAQKLPAILFHNQSVKLVARLAGSAKIKCNEYDVDVGITDFNEHTFLPGDFIARNNEIARVIGLHDNKILILNKEGKINPITDGWILISRSVLDAKRTIQLGDDGCIDISISIPNFKGLQCLPGDEIEIKNIKYVVLGEKDRYIWIRNVDDLSIKSFRHSSLIKSTLISRPTSRIDLLHSLL